MVWGEASTTNIDLAKAAARAWVNALPLGKSECAISSFDHVNYLNQDFTTDKSKLLNAINPLQPNGGTDYDAALIDPMAGGLLVSKKGKHQRVLIFLTDGIPMQYPQVNAIVNEAKNQNCIIYCVTLGMPAPQSVKDIADRTGGEYYENVTTVKEAENVYREILNSAQGGSPCTIEWQSGIACSNGLTNVELKWQSVADKEKYQSPAVAIAKLEIKPNYIAYGGRTPGGTYDTTITLTANNTDITVQSINPKNGNSTAFTVEDVTFPLAIAKNTSKNVTLSFGPKDSLIQYLGFEVITDLCPISFSVIGGYRGQRIANNTLKLTHPNGDELFVVGSDTVITWTGIAPSDTVVLDYSIDNGKSWISITKKATGLSYNWENIPQPPSDKCLVKVKKIQIDVNNSTDSVGQLIQTLRGHNDVVTSVAFSPDGLTLASGSSDNTIKIWDLETWQPLFTIDAHNDVVTSVAFSPDGLTLASGSSDNTIRIWNAITGDLNMTLVGHSGSVNSIAFNPDGLTLASGSDDELIKIWSLETGLEIKSISDNLGYVNIVAISPDGKTLAAGSFSLLNRGKVNFWELETGFSKKVLDDYDGYNLAFSPYGGTFAVTSGSKVVLRNFESDVELHRLTGHGSTYVSGNVTDVAFSPDGFTLASGSVDNTIKVWDTEKGIELLTLTGHGSTYVSGDVTAVAYSNDGVFLASGGRDKTIKIWSMNDGTIGSDQSDAAFNIVEPLAASIDIDMLECLIGTVKDSLVTDFVSNVGSYPFTVDSIYFQGADASAFKLISGIPKYAVNPSQSKFGEFRFIPSRIGLHQAEVVIITQADTIIQNIKGAGVEPQLDVIGNFIDFGQVEVNGLIDTLQVVTIKNIGATPINITNTRHGIPNKVDFSTLAGGGNFTLLPDESAKLDLRFEPSDVGRTSGQLEFIYNGLGSPAVVQLFGEGIKTNPSILATAQTFADLICETKDTIEISVLNNGGEELILSNSTLTGVNSTDFTVINSYPITIEPDSTKLVLVEFTPITAGIKTANLEISSNADPDSLLTLPLSGKKDNIELTVSNTIDLGLLCPNEGRTFDFVVSNIGTVNSVISLTAESELQVEEIETTIIPSGNETINGTFLGLPSEGTFTRKITLIDTLCNTTVEIDVVGEVVKAYLTADNTIDLGLLCPNESKTFDFVVSNIGTVNSVISLTAESELQVEEIQATIIPSGNETINGTFLGLPSEGTFTRKITLIDTLCDATLEIDVVGEVANAFLQSDDLALTSGLSVSKPGLVRITNPSKQEIVITDIAGIIAPFEFDGVNFPLIITANNYIDVPILFTPTNINEVLIDLIVSATPCNILDTLTLTGKGSISSISQKVPTYSAFSGEIITIAPIITNKLNVEASGVKSLKGNFYFNPTLLYPIDHSMIIVDESTAYIELTNLPTNKAVGESITEIKFRVGLGNAEECILRLGDLQSVGGTTDISVEDGRFELLGICYEGGTRLLNPNKKAGIQSLTPNPAEDILNINVSLTEKGKTEILIYDISGEIVKTIISKETINTGSLELSINLNELSNGAYSVVLITPTFVNKESLIIAK
jgi:WD40 repeat protein